jgi:hypothetical protein
MRRLNGRRGPTAVQGLPEGIAFETLNELCVHHLGEPIKHVSHVHLSGWKPSGSYRLLLQTERGCHWRLVYRNAIYHPDHIPALAGLPIIPGHGEYLVYSNARGALAKYLPAVHWCSEVVPGEHYQYLLEDLGDEYRKANTPEAILRAGAELHAVHRAMEEWSASVDHSRLLRYDDEFSTALREYARTNLEVYVRKTPSEGVAEVLELWPRIAEVHGRREFRDLRTIRPIHGDFNTSNILIHREYPDRIKLIDWEWAGHGTAHADLASLLKRATPAVEEHALATFFRQCNRLSLHEHRRLYEWCQLERGLTDAAFLAVQHIECSGPTRLNIPGYIERSLRRLLRAHQALV